MNLPNWGHLPKNKLFIVKINMNTNITKEKITKLAEEHRMIVPEAGEPGIEMVDQEITPTDGTEGTEMVPELPDDADNNAGLYKLSQETVTELTDRLKDEYTAHYFYRNAANWCADANYKKAAAFFVTEADTELVHAKGLQDYMTGFNIIPVIPAAETTKQFTSLPQIIREAYGIELDLMKKYNMSSAKLFGSDLTTFDFLQGYREIQKESVVEYNDLINGLALVNEDNKLDVLYFEQTYM
jgi:ferritin